MRNNIGVRKLKKKTKTSRPVNFLNSSYITTNPLKEIHVFNLQYIMSYDVLENLKGFF